MYKETIKSFFHWPWLATELMHTPYGTIRLARRDRKKVESVLSQIKRSTVYFTRKDMADWRKAWQKAINPEDPQRYYLYQIYRDVAIDLHLSGCVGQRKGFVLAKGFKLLDKDGNENEDAKKIFDQHWFKHLSKMILDTPYYGHTLLELGNVTRNAEGVMGYDDVTLIPREYVVPEFGRCRREKDETVKDAVPYREQPYADCLIECGDPEDLGLYLKAATQTIPKKNTMASWDTFSEIFGMPMRIARTNNRDKQEVDRLESMLRDSGESLYLVTDLETQIEFVENSRGDAYNVYDKRIDRANSELSKLIIGQTMTIEDGSSLSQSKTHLEVFENIVDEDRDMLRDVINNQLLPKMAKAGFPVAGLTYEWDRTVEYSPEQQLAYEKFISQLFDIDPDYLTEKYGVPCSVKKEDDEDKNKGKDKEELMIQFIEYVGQRIKSDAAGLNNIDVRAMYRDFAKEQKQQPFFD